MIRRLLFGWQQATLLLLILVVLDLLANYNYLAFHTVVELLRVIVLGGVFVLGWHTRRWSNNGALLVFAIAAGFIGVLELLHALTYKGMGLMPVDDANIPTQLWIAFRYIEVIAVLLASLTLGKKVNIQATFFSFAALATFFCITIFNGSFPVAFIEGQGLTPFKIYSEWGMIVVFIIAMVLILKDKKHLEKDVRWLIAASLFASALTSLAFTQYADVFDFANKLGHYLLLVSVYLIYRAILVTGLLRPYELLFLDLKKNEQRLENLIVESTASLRETQALNTAFIDNIPSSISVKDIHSRYTLVNLAFEKLVGQSKDKVLGKTFYDILPLKLAQSVAISLEAVRANEKPCITYDEIDFGHQSYSFETIHFPVKDTEGHLLGSGTIATDITEQKASRERIKYLAHFDPLTGLANKVYFMEKTEQLLEKNTAKAPSYALIYFDLDHFKDVNDSLGHEVGDKFLLALAKRLQALIGEQGLLCRYSGDEFLLLLYKSSNKAYIADLVAHLQAELAVHELVDSYDLTITTSVGIAVYPNDGQDFKTLFRNASSAMYAVKADGRNSYQFFEENMQTAAQERLSLLTKLRVALDRNELSVYYQPQYNQAGTKVVGAEALVRWQHPELGFISPVRFIPIAEDSGLITVIGEWVLNQACQQAVQMQQAGIEPFIISVNLSAVQFRKGDLVEVVKNALDKSGLKPEYLDLELTESLLLKDQQRLLQMLQQLKLLGVKLSIDDFGTGYSNLSYLKRFAVDKLKIDQSFVRDMENDADDYALVKAIIQLAHSLGLIVTAEGVETEQQVKILTKLKCDEFQGYYFAKPMPADAFVKHLQATSLTQ
ncbi:MAG TPA: EAL domain-containing protein [Marinospirillum sp.]|uniref:bifunctional diguanylate cyclase/phosphodiesterase n=1 Tax=Marinospirillum sp. TaxID=2183934 RepID=UPI002B48E3BE|nr:EAL domain-containing protein [Marinospirillum sp.]HKM15040.1 EAL domain-containing protein [Marinospirillum sp.]